MKLNPALEGADTPERIRALPIAENGFYVPWFVIWLEGKPEFRVMDAKKFVRAVKEKLCWVCGGPLDRAMIFAVGPMCGINRTSAEPPSHPECARFSVRYCPFLSRPNMVRREAGIAEMGGRSAGFMIKRNPGVMALWATKMYTPFKNGDGYLFRMGEPTEIEWWREGRFATRAEVAESIRTGLPALRNMALEEEVVTGRTGAIAALMKTASDFKAYYPPEGVSRAEAELLHQADAFELPGGGTPP
jgi:hypothetical protein